MVDLLRDAGRLNDRLLAEHRVGVLARAEDRTSA